LSGVVKEGGFEGVGAKGLTEKTEAPFYLRVVAIKKGEGLL
jgi:hypothetical protein